MFVSFAASAVLSHWPLVFISSEKSTPKNIEKYKSPQMRAWIVHVLEKLGFIF